MSLILSGTDGLSDVDGTAATPAIRGTDANTGIFFPAADTIAFAEGGAEAARFDSAGNFGLGVTPSAWDTYKVLEAGFAGSAFLSNAGSSQVGIVRNGYWASGGWKYAGTGTATLQLQQNGEHQFWNAGSGTAGNAITFTQAMTLDASGGLKTLNTIGVGNATPSTSGAGITFPATQSASSNLNTLDDYEEGTWTPTIGGNNEGTGGGAGNVYSTQVGTYVKVGKVVTCNCNVNLSTASGNSGVVIFINNFPFPANATTGSLPYVSVSWQGLSSSYVNVMGYFNANESRLHLVGITAAATTIQTFISPAQLTNTSGFIVTFTYITT
jgi:hypothetical protein